MRDHELALSCCGLALVLAEGPETAGKNELKTGEIMGKSRIGRSLGIVAIVVAWTIFTPAGPAGAGMSIKGPVVGAPTLGLGAYDLKPLGYVVEEFFLSSTAASYRHVGELGADGRWTAEAQGSSPFTTRVVVVRPADAAKFNGTVLVEWLNVSGGLDSPPDWMASHRELIRDGYAYVGVSVQKVGVEGGQSLALGAQPLKKSNPERYAALDHPGDAYAFDIFSQAGQAVRANVAGGVLGPLKAKHVLAAGESQSAVFLTTYVNAIDPIAKVFDGFLIHSRFGTGAPIEGTSMMAADMPATPQGVKLRGDLRVPVITVITETDLVGGRLGGFFGARQPDNEKLRIWEIPGTAHADTYTFAAANIDSGSAPIAALAAAYAPTDKMFGMTLLKPVNAAPQHHYVVSAAVHALNLWVGKGMAPAKAPRMDASEGDKPGDPPKLHADANGNTLGGIRTPWVDVPTARLSGVGNDGGPLGFLVGVTENYDQATLNRLYHGGKADYLKKFDGSLDASIKSGFILAADRSEIRALAGAMYPGSK